MIGVLARLARAVFAGIGTVCETLIPGPDVHRCRVDFAEVLAEAEAQYEVSDPAQWFPAVGAVRATHIEHGCCTSRNPNDPPYVATICDERLGHDGDHRHGRSEVWPAEVSAAGFEELLDAEVPCGGTRAGRECGHAAVLRGLGHGDPPTSAQFKCIPCWQLWYAAVVHVLAEHGSVKCFRCGRTFVTAEAFNDYRPF